MSLAGALLVGALAPWGCSPTDVDPEPLLGGPDQVHGEWENFMIVCSIPLTLTTPYPIRIDEGKIRATFPAEGEPVAQVNHELNGNELDQLWGGDWEGQVTRSLQIRPAVQHLDYEVTVEFVYSRTNSDRAATGVLKHHFFCLAPLDPEPAPGPDAEGALAPGPPDLDVTLPEVGINR